MMDPFWEIVKTWDKLGQGVFFLILASAVFGTIATLGYYITVCFRGWPPAHCSRPPADEQ
jgi:hypothetical protein